MATETCRKITLSEHSAAIKVDCEEYLCKVKMIWKVYSSFVGKVAAGRKIAIVEYPRPALFDFSTRMPRLRDSILPVRQNPGVCILIQRSMGCQTRFTASGAVKRSMWANSCSTGPPIEGMMVSLSLLPSRLNP